MLSRISSFILQGIDATPCDVEIDVIEGDQTEKEIVVGLPDAAVKEAVQRVRAAVTNCGYRYPRGRIVVNLAPADVRKEGPVYDLPLAVGLLCATGIIRPARELVPAGAPGDAPEAETPAPGFASDPIDHRSVLFAGELALDGRVRPIRGAIAMAMLARERGMRGVVVPRENAGEAAVVGEIDVFGVQTLTEVVALLNGDLAMEPHPPVDVAGLIEQTSAEVDFAEVRGQEPVKRAITVAAAGSHNLLMLGPPGTGKSMMAKALPGVLPPLSVEESLAVTRVYSAAGRRPNGLAGCNRGLVTRRVVRCPHHTASASAVIGGGAIPQPGEISLAHHGILFLDELPEFPRAVLDTLRQPLEDGSVTIARAHSTIRFPASFMLVTAMNPSTRGTMPDTPEGRRDMDRYMARVSGPLIDRIDLHVEVPAVSWKELSGAPRGTGTEQMRHRVLEARERQHRRQGHRANAHLRGKDLDELATLDEPASLLLGQALTELGLSARAYDKIRRVARTIADIEGADTIGASHVAEAVQYRLLDRAG